ncbi:MAG: trypsin-like peptidase domain-containing protein [Candidatus Schekmanbacteria bacterium]|nr:trypsin-like peptidase domain-containing protein [Candidatus Schekmanbacteria bacterium]
MKRESRHYVAAAALLVVIAGAAGVAGKVCAGPAASPRTVEARGPLRAQEQEVADLFDRVSGSVVFITTSEVYRDFFTRNATEVPSGAGTGFVWDEDGHVVTNFHVVASGSAVTVTLAGHEEYRAKVVGAAPDKDLAVLKIEARGISLAPIPLGTSSDLRVGQSVFAIGNPFGLDQTLTMGIVSALGRSMTAISGRTIEGVIQTDAAINPGNSGGPLLDSAGRLVGVNTAIQSPSGASAGIGFAVPVDIVNRVVPQLIQYGRLVRPTLGVVFGERLSRRLGLPGLLILDVGRGTGAEAAGLRPTMRDRRGGIELGDVVTKVDGVAVETLDALLNVLERHQVGDVVEVEIRREDRTLTEKVRLGDPSE